MQSGDKHGSKMMGKIFVYGDGGGQVQVGNLNNVSGGQFFIQLMGMAGHGYISMKNGPNPPFGPPSSQFMQLSPPT